MGAGEPSLPPVSLDSQAPAADTHLLPSCDNHILQPCLLQLYSTQALPFPLLNDGGQPCYSQSRLWERGGWVELGSAHSCTTAPYRPLPASTPTIFGAATLSPHRVATTVYNRCLPWPAVEGAPSALPLFQEISHFTHKSPVGYIGAPRGKKLQKHDRQPWIGLHTGHRLQQERVDISSVMR